MTESAHEQRVVRLLEEQTRVLHSIDTALTDVVAVIQENTQSVVDSAAEIADKIEALDTITTPAPKESMCCSDNPGANDGCCPSSLS